MQYFILTVAAAVTGGLIGIRLKLPAGAMIGSMAAVVCINILFQWGYIPQDIRKVIQICAGALIGLRMKKKDILGLKEIVLPACVLVFGMIILNFTIGYIINKLTLIDLPTALFASAPGGLSDMAIIADDLGADAPKVAILQLIRLISVIGLFPILLKSFCTRFSAGTGVACKESSAAEDIQRTDSDIKNETGLSSIAGWKSFGITICTAGLGGAAALLLKVPAGAMIGSMIAVIVYNIYTGKAYVPKDMRKATQIAAGALIGSKMGMNDILAMKSIMVPGIILVISLIVLNFTLGFVISKVSKLDMATSLFASAPGGLSDMALIADELGADSPKVTIMQLLRLISVITVFPILLKFICAHL